MKPDTLLWCVRHNGEPISVFSSRKTAIDAACRAILERAGTRPLKESYVELCRQLLVATGSVCTDLYGNWSVESIAYWG